MFFLMFNNKEDLTIKITLLSTFLSEHRFTHYPGHDILYLVYCIKAFKQRYQQTLVHFNFCTCNGSCWQCIPHGAWLSTRSTWGSSEWGLHIWETWSTTLGIWANLRLSRPAWSSTHLSHLCWTVESLRLRQCWNKVPTSTTRLEHLLWSRKVELRFEHTTQRRERRDGQKRLCSGQLRREAEAIHQLQMHYTLVMGSKLWNRNDLESERLGHLSTVLCLFNPLTPIVVVPHS